MIYLVKNITLLTIITFTLSCRQQDTKKENTGIFLYKQTSFTNEELKILLDKSIVTGDTLIYNQAMSHYIFRNMGEEVYVSSLIMAHKFKYPQAYYNIYIILSHLNSGETLNDLGESIKYKAFYYLIKSYELGCVEAKYGIMEEFGSIENIERSSFYLHKYMNELEDHK